jgi:hypothetical protein
LTPPTIFVDPRPSLALLGPTPEVARSFVPRLERQLSAFSLVPLSLARFLSDRRAPSRVVLCPGGASLPADLAFLESTRRRVLWPPPGVDLWGAIAGLRGSHEAPPRDAPTPGVGRSRRTSALLLEGDVTLASARRAAASGAPRHWIVERVQRVRISEGGLERLRLRGIRWSVLEPVEVIGIAASSALASDSGRWRSFLPAEVPMWVFPK